MTLRKHRGHETALPVVAMLSGTPINHDVRVQRQAESLARNGAHVQVWRTTALHPGESFQPCIEVRQSVVYRNKPRARSLQRFWISTAIRLRAGLNRLTSPLGWGLTILSPVQVKEILIRREVRRLSPTHVHHFDYGTLELAAQIAHENRAALVSDLYEAPLLPEEAGSDKQRHRAERQWASLAHRTPEMRIRFTVSPPLADFLDVEFPGVQTTVLLNSPRISKTRILSCKDDVRAAAKLSQDTPLLVYPGLVWKGRGLESLDTILKELPACHLALVGAGGIASRFDFVDSFLDGLPPSVRRRVYVLPMQPADCLPHFLRTADVGVFLPDDATLNHRVTGPNKFFEMLLAGLPLVVSDLGLMGDIVRLEGIGIPVPAGDTDSAVSAVRQVLQDKRALRPNEEDLLSLRRRYGWEAQERALIAAYKNVPTRASGEPHP